MFPRSRGFNRILSILLALSLSLTLVGCETAPSGTAEALRGVPALISRVVDALDDLAGWLDFWLDGMPASPLPVPDESSFAVHFLDVGQADSALVMCDGDYMLIDGGNAGDSDLVFSYLKSHDVDHLDYMIATHAHEDHIGGLSGAAYASTIDTALSPVTKGDTKVFKNLVKSLAQQDVTLTVPDPGDTFTLGSARVEVLGPLEDYDDTNDTSIVLRVQYGSTVFLFTGDMETTAEDDLMEAGIDLSATVLKVGHHGSDSSTSYHFLREVMPDYAVISVGAGNKYGHPNEEVLSRLEDADVTVYRTDLQGTVIAESDGTTVSFYTEK